MSISSDRVKKWRKTIKEKLIFAMGGSCQKCGYSRCSNALEFHHTDPNEKEISLGGIRASPKSIMKIIEEVKKCVLVCSICHREHHAGILELPKTNKLDLTVFGLVEIDGVICKNKKIPEIRMSIRSIKIPKVKKSRKRSFEVTFEELSDLLKTKSYAQVGKIYGVSDNAIRKRAKALEIPLIPRCIKMNSMDLVKDPEDA